MLTILPSDQFVELCAEREGRGWRNRNPTAAERPPMAVIENFYFRSQRAGLLGKAPTRCLGAVWDLYCLAFYRGAKPRTRSFVQ